MKPLLRFLWRDCCYRVRCALAPEPAAVEASALRWLGAFDALLEIRGNRINAGVGGWLVRFEANLLAATLAPAWAARYLLTRLAKSEKRYV